MSHPALADVARHLASLAAIRGGDGAHDLREAATALDGFPPARLDAALQHLRDPSVSAVEGLPLSVIPVLREALVAGPDAALRSARQRIPFLLRRLLDLGAVTHDEASALATRLNVVTLPDLLAAFDDRRTSLLSAISHERLSASLDVLRAEHRPVPLGRAFDILAAAQEALAAQLPQVDGWSVAGDARRFEPLVGSLALVGRSADPDAALGACAVASGIDDIFYRTPRRAVLFTHGVEVDLRIAAPDEYGTVLFAATGSRDHVAQVRRRRAPLDLCAREAEVYSHAGLAWIPPELRQASGELEAAAAGRLPRLVEHPDIRGDLHLHTTYSDGQDTLEAMLTASARLGYAYVAITDHSERAAAARTMTPDQLARQRDELERLRDRFPGLAILHGIEVDILPDGRLDFDDRVLERLDIVLASLHDAAGQDGAALTRRCIQAMQHPLVNVITHPANRLVGRREGYPLDYEAVYAAAVETGTALEIDGAPSHLDLDGEHARAAVAAGVTVTIDSDCHRARALHRQMRLGVGTARRGWVEPRHVLNARPLADVRAFIAAKRKVVGPAC